MSLLKHPRPRVTVTRRLPEVVESRMKDLFETTLRNEDAPLSHDELKAAIADCDVFVPTVTDEIDADIIAAASPELKLIANADLTMALILAVPRRLVEGDRRTRAGNFDGWSPTFMLGHRVRGKKLGIIGMGRIGQAVARRAAAFGLDVHYHNRRRLPGGIEDTLDATYWPELDAMLTAVDILSINCPSTPQTYHLINAERLKLLSPESYIVNTSRGEVIDEAALAKVLSKGELGGAGLDVYEEEPKVHPDLMDLPNVILAPHIGSATHESRREMGEKVMINIRALMDGHAYPDRVLPPGSRFPKAS